ncbi:MAG: hypothetical protein DMD35_16175 [Gemmatimonadetes bacterium]|nr:MAG: hypothetical protein DMD35_16175 [Gemmatimonadota bacterium]
MTAPAIATTRGTRWPSVLVLLAAGFVSALLLWSRRDYVPIFDGRIYADCIAKVAADPGYIGGYRCAGHIAESYVAILAVAARLAPGTPVALLVANALLLALGAAALWRLTRSVFPDAEHRVGRALVVGAFLVHPVVLASVVQPGLDLGLLVFSLCALAAAVEGRRWTLVVFGILLIFSKEPGVMLYGVIVAVWLWRRCESMLSPDDATRVGVATLVLLGFMALIGHDMPSALFFLVAAVVVALRPLRPSLPPGQGLVGTVVREWPLAIPVAFLFGYLVYYKLRATAAHDGSAQPVVWGGGGGARVLLKALVRGGIFDGSTRSSLALMFVVGFLWVPTLWVLADLAIGAVRHVRNLPARPLRGVDRSALGFVVVVLLANVWLLSRFVTFSNPRYYLPVFPLGLLVAYAALVRLRVRPLGRAAILASVTALLAISAVRTVDPVSRVVWGTFKVGDRSLLSITSLRNECCGHGRDQLGYNLEFTEFASLQDALYERLKPTDSTVLVLPPNGDWFTVDALDSVTHHRTLRASGTLRPRVIMAPDAYDLAARRAWYVEMPFIPDTIFRVLLARRFDISEPCRITHQGYAMDVREMRLRSSAAARPSSATQPASDIAGASPCAPSESVLSAH